MAVVLLNELQTICTQGAIEQSGENIERLKAACHTKLSETESETETCRGSHSNKVRIRISGPRWIASSGRSSKFSDKISSVIDKVT